MKTDMKLEQIEIHGDCDPRFSAVKEVFADNFRQRGDVGASFAAVLNGRFVVDLWAGYADAARTRPWGADTLACIYSTTKALTALCALVLVDRGRLDLDAPVARYWPEFAQAGKQDIPVRYLLSHQSGVAGIDADIPLEALYDWERIVNLLAAQRPWWEPGTQAGYHAITFGYLVGEVIRRIRGGTVGKFLREELAGPLHADCHIGLPPEHAYRAAEMIPPSLLDPGQPGNGAPAFFPGTMIWRAMAPLMDPVGASNTAPWRAAEIPAANGFTNARSLARLASVLACDEIQGLRLLGPRTIESAFQEQWHGTDGILMQPVRWALGFLLAGPENPFGAPPGALLAGGGGGSGLVIDRGARLSMAYVMNNCLGTAFDGDDRAAALARAAYAAL